MLGKFEQIVWSELHEIVSFREKIKFKKQKKQNQNQKKINK